MQFLILRYVSLMCSKSGVMTVWLCCQWNKQENPCWGRCFADKSSHVRVLQQEIYPWTYSKQNKMKKHESLLNHSKNRFILNIQCSPAIEDWTPWCHLFSPQFTCGCAVFSVLSPLLLEPHSKQFEISLTWWRNMAFTDLCLLDEKWKHTYNGYKKGST